MAQIAAYDDVKANCTKREVNGGYAFRTDFLIPPAANRTEPHAFLAERTPNGVIRPHYHDVDQFQVIVSGGGTFGKHGLAIHAVHFARANTPYGPIAADERGVGFLTLRRIRSGGFFPVPESNEMLKSIPYRRPWQVTELPKFDAAGDVSVHAFSQMKDEHGLAAYSLKLAPNTKTSAPDPSASNGQYLIITKGSLNYQGKDHKAITIIFVKPDEKPFQLAAGAEGMEALVLNFPRDVAQASQTTKAPAATKAAESKFRVWQCMLCAFTYDEAKGMPEEGVPPGTRWEDVPDTWTCPDCSASKSDFEMEVAG